MEGAPKFYSCDFSHQYVRFGGYGNIWGLVTVDPDGISNFVFLPSAALSCGSFQFLSLHLSAGHILPIAIGHQCGSESEDSWSWFFAEILSAFPEFENAAILMDRDKGGDSASRYFVLYFWLLCILGEKHVFFPEISCLRPMCNHVQCTSAIMSGSAMGRRQQGCSSLQLRRRLNEAFILILQSFSSKSSLFLWNFQVTYFLSFKKQTCISIHLRNWSPPVCQMLCYEHLWEIKLPIDWVPLGLSSQSQGPAIGIILPLCNCKILQMGTKAQVSFIFIFLFHSFFCYRMMFWYQVQNGFSFGVNLEGKFAGWGSTYSKHSFQYVDAQLQSASVSIDVANASRFVLLY